MLQRFTHPRVLIGAIGFATGVLPATRGYAVMWPVLAARILAVPPRVLRLSRVEHRAAKAS